jgi:hypothetical protein
MGVVTMAGIEGSRQMRGAGHPVDDVAELNRLQAENAALRSRLSRRRDVRRWVSYAMVVISALLVLASTVAVWAYRTALDTDRFMATVEPVLDDPAFYSALSDRVSDEVLVALDLETRVTLRLNQLDDYVSGALVDAIEPSPQAQDLLDRFDRPTLAALAPPITSALEDRVAQLVDRFVTSEAFTTRLPTLVREAHEAGVALVRNDMAALPNVYTADGEVRLNLIPIIREVLSQVVEEIRDFLPDVELPDTISNRVDDGVQQLGDALQAQLPADFGQVTLMSQDALGGVQESVHRLDQLVWLLVLVTVASIGATIAIAPNRRRALVYLGIGIVIALLLGGIALRRLRAAVLAEAATPDGERAASLLLDQMLSSVRTIALIVGIVAVLGAALAYLAGRPAWVGRLTDRGSRLIAEQPGGSELDRWVAKHYELLRIAGIVVAIGIVFLTGIEIIPVLIVGGLVALFLWGIAVAHRRASVLEQPPAVVGQPVTGSADEGQPVT